MSRSTASWPQHRWWNSVIRSARHCSRCAQSELPSHSRITACLEEAKAKARKEAYTESLRMLAVAVQVFVDALQHPPSRIQED